MRWGDRHRLPRGSAFDAIGLARLPTLAFVGLMTFQRVLIGGAAGLLASALSSLSVALSLPVGAVIAGGALVRLTKHQRTTWLRAEAENS